MKTSRILTIAAALLLTVTFANAQTWYITPKAGYAASRMPGTKIYGYERVVPHSSFYGGVAVNCDVNGLLLLESGIMYAGKGHTDRSEIDGRYSRQLNYLQLPLLAGIQFADGNASVVAGPELGFLTNSTVKEGPLKWNGTDDCYRFNIALGLQLNYMVTEELGVDLKFDWGLNRTLTHFHDEEDKGHNMTIQVGLCYRIEL